MQLRPTMGILLLAQVHHTLAGRNTCTLYTYALLYLLCSYGPTPKAQSALSRAIINIVYLSTLPLSLSLLPLSRGSVPCTMLSHQSVYQQAGLLLLTGREQGPG